jgi:hypothetical protein
MFWWKLLAISVNTFPLPKLGVIYGIINNICHLLQAVTYFPEVNDWYLTKTLRGLSHLHLVTIIDTTVLPNNEITAQQNQIDWNHKIKETLCYKTVRPGAFTPISHTLRMALAVSYFLIR